MLTLPTAKRYAEELKKRISPFCKKIEIAGSIRREKLSGIKDIELVVIPNTIETFGNLFENETVRDPGFIKWVNSWDKVKGDPRDGKYCQRIITEGVILDLFIAEPENFGWQLILRTGSSEFNQNLLKELKNRDVHSIDGYLYLKEERIDTPTEDSVFALLGIGVIPPRMRSVTVLSV